MKRGLAALALGLIALGVQGGLATFVPRELCPDLGLLVVISLGLRDQRWSSGFFLATALGYAADLMSGSLFGAHALLRLLAFCAATLVRSKLNLRGAIPLGVFVAVTTMLYAVGLFSLTGFFGAAGDIHWAGLRLLIPHALANAIAVPAVSSFMNWVWMRLEGEPIRRGLELAPRRSVV